MRAVVCDRLGDPSVLQILEMPIPAIGPSDVLIKVGLPRSMPYFYGSLKVAITLAFVGTTVSEYAVLPMGIPAAQQAAAFHQLRQEVGDLQQDVEVLDLSFAEAVGMLQIEPAVLLDVESFVLDLPAASPAVVGQGRGGVGRDLEVGQPDEPRPLRAVAARHEVLAVEVLDPRDVELPDVGDVVLQDAESGATREFTIDAQLRDDFGKAAAAHRAEVSRTIRSCGAPLMTLRTDRDWIADIVRFVESRRRGAVAGRQ